MNSSGLKPTFIDWGAFAQSALDQVKEGAMDWANRQIFGSRGKTGAYQKGIEGDPLYSEEMIEQYEELLQKLEQALSRALTLPKRGGRKR